MLGEAVTVGLFTDSPEPLLYLSKSKRPITTEGNQPVNTLPSYLLPLPKVSPAGSSASFQTCAGIYPFYSILADIKFGYLWSSYFESQPPNWYSQCFGKKHLSFHVFDYAITLACKMSPLLFLSIVRAQEVVLVPLFRLCYHLSFVFHDGTSHQWSLFTLYTYALPTKSLIW